MCREKRTHIYIYIYSATKSLEGWEKLSQTLGVGGHFVECVSVGVRCKLIVMQRKWDYTENHQTVMTTMSVHNHNYNNTTTNTTQPKIFKSRYSDWAKGRTARKMFALGRDKIIFFSSRTFISALGPNQLSICNVDIF